jgi:cytosine/adenosine deaminase-related metal-dependent hydrolase
MKKYIADYVYTVNADPIKNGVVTVDETGRILAIEDENALTRDALIPYEKLDGVLCPGFINTHCHLELSHLKNKIEPKQGLVSFIKNVQKLRAEPDDVVLIAAIAADEEMYKNGIVAVADISNTQNVISVKKASNTYYHTFVEVFGFTPQNAVSIFNSALEICESHKPLKCSITPHASYSVSKELFKLVKKLSDEKSNLISLHNQESEEENKLYRYKLGEFVELYQYLNIDISFFKPQARNSIQSIIPLLSTKPEILLVHNTYTNLKDIYFIKRFDKKINWCFCPAANLYIEGRLPKVDLFLEQGFNITLGTDSLASNDKLCILNEMRIIQENFPEIEFGQLLKWGTLNGARFLDIAYDKGSIEVGKTPGLNLITGLDGQTITKDTKVKRII